ncbi:MAG: YicC/YloC family endoribonuclease [Pseudomonadota bacterium]
MVPTQTDQPTANGDLSSMTGFARQAGQIEGFSWVWEVRSVNGRGLELRTRLPHGFDDLEMTLKPLAARRLSRGSLNATLKLTEDQPAAGVRVNSSVLNQLLPVLADIGSRLPDAVPPSPEGVLALRGVLEPEDTSLEGDARKRLVNALSASFEEAVVSLDEARRHEGLALTTILSAHIDEIAALTGEAASQAEKALTALREKLQTQVAELVGDNTLDPDRLAQEVALLAVKADVREELDRLVAHVTAARALLSAGEPVGRKFDFLVQEFNREANTLCAKAGDMTLKRTGLSLKAVIDQLREQVQNVE